MSKQKAYSEKYRPQVHFSPRKGWMNDPNGLVYFRGEYHLFYQHYPDDTIWGPMHWGHAVSSDLVHWKELPIAFFPDQQGYIFSGCAVADLENTSGFGSKENPPLVAIFTYHDSRAEEEGRVDVEVQAVAYSLDSGRTWTKSESNPVLKNPGIKDFRDPKVFWYPQTEKWIMVLAVADRIHLYGSSNLLQWEFLSDFGANAGAHGGVWECPDLFPLATDEGTFKWLLLVSINPGGPQKGSATQYFIGDFDGYRFTADDDIIRWIDFGADNYAGVTFSNVEANDNRKLMIGWMSNWLYAHLIPTTTWRGAMTFPRSLELDKDVNGYFVRTPFIAELAKLRKSTIEISSESTKLDDLPAAICFENISGLDFSLILKNETGDRLQISINEGSLSIDRSESGVADFHNDFAARHQAERAVGSLEKLQILLDFSSVEVSLNDGEVCMTELIFPKGKYDLIVVDGHWKQGQVSLLNSIW